jgi:antitoxin component YwqK of YwqJK toxin-antitoxin module
MLTSAANVATAQMVIPKGAVDFDDMKLVENITHNEYTVIKIYHYKGEPFTGIAFHHARYGDVLIPFKDGMRHGLTQSWYKSGEKKGFLLYENGMTLTNKLWFKNGQQRWEHYHVDGYRSGTHKVWTEEGQQISEEKYENKGKDRTTKTWHRNGKKKSKGKYSTYRTGHTSQLVKEGKWIVWDEKGKRVSKYFYEKGIQLESKTYKK